MDCHDCGISKAHRIVSRRLGHELGASRPFETVAIDLIKLDCPGYNSHKYVLHAICLYTKMHFVFTIKKKDKLTILGIVTQLDRLLKRRYNCSVTFIITDDERGFGWKDDSVRLYCTEEGITFNIRAPYTPEQNGAAERSGRILIERARTMRIAANLPISLGPECYIAAAYILNRTPTRSLNWKTPFEMANGKKPSIAYMHVFGCKAYALRTKIPRGDKLTERALVRYLVGYDSTNIYRIWIPRTNSVIRSRDVTFREESFYQPDEEETMISREELHIISIPEPEEESEDELLLYNEPANTLEEPGTGSETNVETSRTKETLHRGTQGLQTPVSLNSPQPLSHTAELYPPQPRSYETIDNSQNFAPNRERIAGHISQDFIQPEGSRRPRKRRKIFSQAEFTQLNPFRAY